ncbi:MAG TPA: hypothetical protein VE422_07185 [Terriglobia bacterium]|nr:hypothetical protein [Terriglobia bacterium]
MRTRLISLIAALAAVLLLSPAASAYASERQRQGGRGRGNAAPEPPDTRPFDPHDLSGYWLKNTVRPREHPPLTPAGVEAMKGRIPDYQARVPTDNNDPMYKCNPQGFPRLVWEENEPLEILMLPDRVLQLFQWERTLRELWLDGRQLPSGENLENLGPAWYGHSVAHWEEDTLVVMTTGVDERAWLDEYANPKSFDAKFEERYRRTSFDIIEGQLTINDPKNFTAPWVHPKSTFRRMRPQDITFFGWKGLFSGVTDGICAPVNEIDDFNKRIRDPAVFGDTKK